jgi:hypothetical protein
MACKLWKNILPDKTRNRKAEVLLSGFVLKYTGDFRAIDVHAHPFMRE